MVHLRGQAASGRSPFGSGGRAAEQKAPRQLTWGVMPPPPTSSASRRSAAGRFTAPLSNSHTASSCSGVGVETRQSGGTLIRQGQQQTIELALPCDSPRLPPAGLPASSNPKQPARRPTSGSPPTGSATSWLLPPSYPKLATGRRASSSSSTWYLPSSAAASWGRRGGTAAVGQQPQRRASEEPDHGSVSSRARQRRVRACQLHRSSWYWHEGGQHGASDRPAGSKASAARLAAPRRGPAEQRAPRTASWRQWPPRCARSSAARRLRAGVSKRASPWGGADGRAGRAR